jgi:hypothetical protein
MVGLNMISSRSLNRQADAGLCPDSQQAFNPLPMAPTVVMKPKRRCKQ